MEMWNKKCVRTLLKSNGYVRGGDNLRRLLALLLRLRLWICPPCDRGHRGAVLRQRKLREEQRLLRVRRAALAAVALDGDVRPRLRDEAALGDGLRRTLPAAGEGGVDDPAPIRTRLGHVAQHDVSSRRDDLRAHLRPRVDGDVPRAEAPIASPRLGVRREIRVLENGLNDIE